MFKLEVIEDTAGTKIFTLNQLELAPAFPKDITSDEAICLAKDMGANLGQRQGEHILKELGASNVSLEWEWRQRRQYYFLLPGTKLKDRIGYIYIPYIYFNSSQYWEMGFRWIHHAFLPPARLLRPIA